MLDGLWKTRLGPRFLAKRLAGLEEKSKALAMTHGTFRRNMRNQLKQVFNTLRVRMTPPDMPNRPIGFVTNERKSKGCCTPTLSSSASF